MMVLILMAIMIMNLSLMAIMIMNLSLIAIMIMTLLVRRYLMQVGNTQNNKTIQTGYFFLIQI